jgi:branched-subunit amino acid transport protein
MEETIVLTILGMMLVTYIPRLLPVWALSTRTLPPLIKTWLSYVPVAVLAAMLLPSIVIVDGRVSLQPDNLFL